tara:strand:- start:1 stop:303 length:303 start_codon:yes stop_codon:yes gene_type:complete
VTPEAKVKKKVYKILRDNGAYYFSPIMSGYGKSGVPDIIVCYNGRFVGIECKVGSKKPTELQQKNLDEIESSGGHTLVINENNTLAVQELFNKFDRWDIE